ncbi:hypothetical protein COH81_12445 [Neisseria meningitidis]|nr:hypothetical protein CIJ64_09140 [Neisseria meningitidis]RNK34025.1 hypothetical protein COH88_10385 [Neisseria meningitidis]RNL14938.1 hypothetical protein COH85_07175 [Neisseria meningitidis]RQK16610.1 hypothetical protein COH81_12445 [Neisseria meningitidis]RQK39130.1 hypothetical protein COH70_09015 [Neisseria meningitidis]
MHTDHGKAFFSKPLQMPNGLDSRLRGNDGLEVARNLKKNRNRTSRIPACAGMTAERFLFFPINS